MDAAPRLIPIFGHRYIVSDDSQQVLSVVGSDVIVYGNDLREYLLTELDDLLGGVGHPRQVAAVRPEIPFWEHVIRAD